MSVCTTYSPGKIDCPVTFIHRDSLDPFIKQKGLQIFDATRWGHTENMYVRFKGDFICEKGWVISGIKGVGVSLKDWVRDPGGAYKSKVIFMITEFYVSNLSNVNKYDDDSWDKESKWVKIMGTDTDETKKSVEQLLSRKWEWDTWLWGNTFPRGYFLTGLYMHQGSLAPRSSGGFPVNVAITVQARHYLKGFTKEYEYGDVDAGSTFGADPATDKEHSLPAGIYLPSFNQNICGIKFDASVIYDTPFYEITNLYIKNVWSELPPDSFSEPEPEPEPKPDTTPIKTDPGSDPNTPDPVPTQTPVVTPPVTPPVNPGNSGVTVDTSGGSILLKDDTVMGKVMDMWENNKPAMIAVLFVIILIMSSMLSDKGPPSRQRRPPPQRRPMRRPPQRHF